MRHLRFVALVASCAVVLAGIFAGSASALTISANPSNADTIATSVGRFRTVNAAGQTLECNVLLVVRFDAGNINYVAPLTRVGAVNGGGAANCTVAGTPIAVILSNFPWTIAADPNSTVANRLLTILGAQFRIGGCIFTGNIGFVPNAAGNPVAAVRTLAGVFAGNPIGTCGNSNAAAGQVFNLSVPTNLIFV